MPKCLTQHLTHPVSEWTRLMLRCLPALSTAQTLPHLTLIFDRAYPSRNQDILHLHIILSSQTIVILYLIGKWIDMCIFFWQLREKVFATLEIKMWRVWYSAPTPHAFQPLQSQLHPPLACLCSSKNITCIYSPIFFPKRVLLSNWNVQQS